MHQGSVMSGMQGRRESGLMRCAALALGLSVGVAAVSAEGGQASILGGVFSKPQAGLGEQKFKEVCSACHNIDEMSGSRFRASWQDQTLGDLFDFMSNAMPQGDPGSLSAAEYTNIIAFFLSQSGYPAGERELPADKGELSKVKVVGLPQ